MGIPVGAHWSWLIIFALVMSILALSYFPWRAPDASPVSYWVSGAVTSLLFFVSVAFHEFAHSYAAVRSGIPVTGITLFFLGGVSRITREPERPATEMLMAVAGPAASLLLAGVFAVLWAPTRNAAPGVAHVALWLMGMNLLLSMFNMVPGFPMDGGRVLRAAVWSRAGDYMKATRTASLVGRFIGYAFIGGGVAVIFATDWLEWQRAVWIVFIGLFLAIAASSAYRQEVLRDNLRKVTAGDVMDSACRKVPAEAALSSLAASFSGNDEPECLLVEQDGRPIGLIGEGDIKRIPRKRRGTATVAEAMRHLDSLASLSPGDTGLQTLEKMEEAGADFLPVGRDNDVMGIVGRDRLLEVGLESPGTKS